MRRLFQSVVVCSVEILHRILTTAHGDYGCNEEQENYCELAPHNTMRENVETAWKASNTTYFEAGAKIDAPHAQNDDEADDNDTCKKSRN